MSGNNHFIEDSNFHNFLRTFSFLCVISHIPHVPREALHVPFRTSLDNPQLEPFFFIPCSNSSLNNAANQSGRANNCVKGCRRRLHCCFMAQRGITIMCTSLKTPYNSNCFRCISLQWISVNGELSKLSCEVHRTEEAYIHAIIQFQLSRTKFAVFAVKMSYKFVLLMLNTCTSKLTLSLSPPNPPERKC